MGLIRVTAHPPCASHVHRSPFCLSSCTHHDGRAAAALPAALPVSALQSPARAPPAALPPAKRCRHCNHAVPLLRALCRLLVVPSQFSLLSRTGSSPSPALQALGATRAGSAVLALVARARPRLLARPRSFAASVAKSSPATRRAVRLVYYPPRSRRARAAPDRPRPSAPSPSSRSSCSRGLATLPETALDSNGAKPG